MSDNLPYDSPAVAEHHVKYETCYADLVGSELSIRNECIERSWQIRDGLLYPTILRHQPSMLNWLSEDVPGQHPAPTVDLALNLSSHEFSFVASTGPLGPTEAPSLKIELGADFYPPARPDDLYHLVYIFQIFPGLPAITTRVMLERHAQPGETQLADQTGAANPTVTGIETTPQPAADQLPLLDRLELLPLADAHQRLIQVTLVDQTDGHNELAFEREWRLHPSELAIDLPGNLFILEDVLTEHGLIFLKHAPLPHARPVQNTVSAGMDLLMRPRTGLLALYGHGLDAGSGEGYAWGVITYEGGKAGRTLALHAYQRAFRTFDPERDARFLSNTWGDRSRDSRINEAFLTQEIAAGARLGVDVIQIDDGWETGRTANSATPTQVWSGFWANNPDFWQPDPQRFPHGLQPVIAQARALGMQFGLWFAPDSADSFANWQRDADILLGLHRELGVNYFKIDGVKALTRTGERNLLSFFNRVLVGSRGKVVFDLDVTAEIRPGYFGAMQVGPLFVENRYTDWHRYWPHATLRNLWQLAHYVDPARLRFEFLNNARNKNYYSSDPLCPAAYHPDYLFATTMFANPLGWFEMTHLPDAYFEQVAPLAQTWKEYRAEIFGGCILPIGAAPDGAAWTGFVSLAADGQRGFALVFRELNPRSAASFELPIVSEDAYITIRLGGAPGGSASLENCLLQVQLPEPRSFLFFAFRL
jgi:alpha-galactosidase